MESGGSSQLVFATRFTELSIERLPKFGKVLEGIKITHKDYGELWKAGGKNIFTFLDPPHFKTTKSKPYDKNGILHMNFNQDEFAREMKKCKPLRLITYAGSLEVRRNFFLRESLRVGTST